MAAIGHPRLPQQQSIQWIRSRLLPSSWRARFRRVLADAQTSSRRPIDFEPFTRALEAVAEQARLDGKDPVEAITASLKNGALLAKQNKSLQNQSAMLGGEIDRLKRELDTKGKHDLPPIIKIPTNNFFRLGEATIETEFKQRLIEKHVRELVDFDAKYDVQIIEVVGHTDELPIANVRSNLDTTLLPFLNEQGKEGDLVAGDNAGLGLARAAAVARVLEGDSRLKKFRILPMSAGQVVDEDRISTGTKPADNASRRRIEIRMRRLN